MKRLPAALAAALALAPCLAAAPARADGDLDRALAAVRRADPWARPIGDPGVKTFLAETRVTGDTIDLVEKALLAQGMGAPVFAEYYRNPGRCHLRILGKPFPEPVGQALEVAARPLQAIYDDLVFLNAAVRKAADGTFPGPPTLATSQRQGRKTWRLLWRGAPLAATEERMGEAVNEERLDSLAVYVDAERGEVVMGTAYGARTSATGGKLVGDWPFELGFQVDRETVDGVRLPVTVRLTKPLENPRVIRTTFRKEGSVWVPVERVIQGHDASEQNRAEYRVSYHVAKVDGILPEDAFVRFYDRSSRTPWLLETD